MSDADKWVMFKNYMHNELGIGREDIRQWIRDAVEDEARRIVAQEAGRFNPDNIIADFVRERVNGWTLSKGKQDLKGEVARQIIEGLDVAITRREQTAPEPT